MHLTSILMIVYGALVAMGGIFGYLKSKSVVSLIAGCVTGLIAIVAGVLYNHSPGVALCLGAAVSLVVIYIMYSRYHSTRKPMPAIPVAVLSAAMYVDCMIKLLPLLHHRAS